MLKALQGNFQDVSLAEIVEPAQERLGQLGPLRIPLMYCVRSRIPRNM
jgi:hypothetical protein